MNSSDSNALMALKGDGSWHSHWFIALYAHSTPMGNYVTSDQPFLDLRQAQESFLRL
jgi:hypothetical protein